MNMTQKQSGGGLMPGPCACGFPDVGGDADATAEADSDGDGRVAGADDADHDADDNGNSRIVVGFVFHV